MNDIITTSPAITSSMRRDIHYRVQKEYDLIPVIATLSFFGGIFGGLIFGSLTYEGVAIFNRDEHVRNFFGLLGGSLFVVMLWWRVYATLKAYLSGAEERITAKVIQEEADHRQAMAEARARSAAGEE
jgi:hypothetical protein